MLRASLRLSARVTKSSIYYSEYNILAMNSERSHCQLYAGAQNHCAEVILNDQTIPLPLGIA